MSKSKMTDNAKVASLKFLSIIIMSATTPHEWGKFWRNGFQACVGENRDILISV